MSVAGATGVLRIHTGWPAGEGGIDAAAQGAAAALCAACPSLVFLALFTYRPSCACWSTRCSRQAARHGRGRVLRGIGQLLTKVFADPAFRQAALNNLVYALGVLIPTLVLALAFALAVQRSTRLSAVLRTIFFSVAGAVGCGGLAVLLHLPAGIGLFDSISPSSACNGPNWLWQLRYRAVVGDRPHGVEERRLLHAVLYRRPQNIPRDTVEAAMIDGANAWQRRASSSCRRSLTTAFVTVIA